MDRQQQGILPLMLLPTKGLQDVASAGKDPHESDTTDDSDDEQPAHHPSATSSKPPHQRLSRQEAKQLDREIPWREILQLPPAYVQKYLAAIEKEANSWLEWNSIQPLTEAEAKHVTTDPVLKHRILKSRAAYRDKNRSQGELRAKCRIVALGHRDPDLFNLERSSPTPNRTTEHILFMFAVAGWNSEMASTDHLWLTWLGDAVTAFLQGTQEDAKRPLPLYMYPPTDGLISKTNCWKHPLYLVLGNIYGLPNAPFLWTQHVVKILLKLGYIRHAWDCMMFLKYNDKAEIISIVVVYVDDFIGTHRSDYNIKELHDSFSWGELSYFELDKEKTFKGKELTFTKNKIGKVTLQITMSKFLDTVEPLSPEDSTWTPSATSSFD